MEVKQIVSCWTKYDIISKSLLMTTIAAIGWYINYKMANTASVRLSADRTQIYIPLLASKSETERLLALASLDYLIQQNLFPPELVTPLMEIIAKDKSKPVRNAAVNIAQKIRKSSDTKLSKIVRYGFSILPPMVDITYKNDEQKEKAEKAKEALTNKGVIVTSIVKESNGPSENELRLFKNDSAEKNESNNIVNELNHIGIFVKTVDRTGKSDANQIIRPKTYALSLGSASKDNATIKASNMKADMAITKE